MYTKSISLKNAAHMYDVPELVQIACRYQSHIMIKNDHSEFNAKSIMGMMSLDPHDGLITVCAEGTDEQEAVEKLCSFMSSEI